MTTDLRALLVEDEPLIAMLFESYVEELGVAWIVRAASLAAGLEAARTGDFDFALLDVNLNGKRSYPIADLLAGRRIPFIFLTGYGQQGLDDRFAGRPVLTKPFSARSLRRVVSRLVDLPSGRASRSV